MKTEAAVERTDEEILHRISEIGHGDFLGFERSDLIGYLPFDKARPHLTEGAAEEQWTQEPRDRDSILKQMHEYMSFAWEKANNMRGISASRSMSHYSAWSWMIGEDFGDLQDYEFYGKPHLVAICERFGWDHKQWDDGERTNG